MLNDHIAQAYRRVGATGRPLDPPLLVVIDEAGNTPLRALPEYASTLAGIGVLFVTIWQSLAQIEASYGRDADTILTNHLTKVLYAGLSDPASLRYVAQVLGDAEVETAPTPDRNHSAGPPPRAPPPAPRSPPPTRYARCNQATARSCTAPSQPGTSAPTPTTRVAHLRQPSPDDPAQHPPVGRDRPRR
ncbi:MAG: TraM recognition domain-containing protein [Acidimicrobiales bacterium]